MLTNHRPHLWQYSKDFSRILCRLIRPFTFNYTVQIIQNFCTVQSEPSSFIMKHRFLKTPVWTIQSLHLSHFSTYLSRSLCWQFRAVTFQSTSQSLKIPVLIIQSCALSLYSTVSQDPCTDHSELSPFTLHHSLSRSLYWPFRAVLFHSTAQSLKIPVLTIQSRPLSLYSTVSQDPCTDPSELSPFTLQHTFHKIPVLNNQSFNFYSTA